MFTLICHIIVTLYCKYVEAVLSYQKSINKQAEELRRVVDRASVIILVAWHENIITNANKKEMVKTNKNTLLIEVKKTVLEMQHLIFLDNLSRNTKMLLICLFS
jgi:hypothetical protein